MNLERRLDNRTPMAARCLPMDDRRGRPVLVVIAKMSYEVSPDGEHAVSIPQAPIRLRDIPHGDGSWSSVRYPGDYVDDKPGTDVIFVGTAHPPTHWPVTQHDVHVQVGPLRKSVRVLGPRLYQSTGLGAVQPGPPAPLGPTPLVYELAAGGYDDSDPARPVIDWRNPAGLGAARDRARLLGKPAPQLEIPGSVVFQEPPGAEPAGFGAIAAAWSPRRERAGTYDEAWRKDRAPVLPADFDPRHNACAHPDLWSATPLVGDEPVEILGATPEGAWRFRLPRFAARFESVSRGVASEHPTHLDTFLIDGNARRVELTWRVSLLLPRKAELLESVRVSTAEELPAELWDDLVARTQVREEEGAA